MFLFLFISLGALFDCIHQNVNLILVLGWPESDLAPFSSVVKNGVVRVVEPYKGSPSPFVGLVAFLPLYSLGILMTCLVIAFSFASGNKCFVYPITNSLDRVPICLFIVLSSLWFRF
jgi:hypothetical protein